MIHRTNFNASKKCSISLEAVIWSTEKENYFLEINCSDRGDFQEYETLVLDTFLSI